MQVKLPIIKSLFFLVLLLICTESFSQITVTFQVDMSDEMISQQGVHIAGSFQSVAGLGDNWNPGSTLMSDEDSDGIYSRSFSLPTGTYEYKFINGDAWGMDENPPGECSVGGTNNRIVTVGNNDLTISPVPFNRCIKRVKLTVNMQGVAIADSGIHVMGSFQEAAGFDQNWDPTSIKMTDFNADQTYEVDLIIPDGNYEYLFVNGNTVMDAEILIEDCSFLGENGTANRVLMVGEGIADPLTYCFATCETCDPNLNTDFEVHWWNDAVFYELFVRSFYDSDNDGIGDFQGIIEKMDYLNDGNPDTHTDLGINALWLMPMMESPSYHGYDVSDYYAIEPDYGSMEDFEEFLDEAHSRGIKVIIDLVLNHSSNEHPWFTQSANSQNQYRDWYVWRDNNPGNAGPWGQNVWHNRGGDYYYGLFWSGMPDLNYDHPPVKEEMFKVVDFWLNLGVDGFRLDAVKYLVEDGNVYENTDGTYQVLEDFNDVYKSNNPEAFTIGEVWSPTATVIPYVQNERLDVCFDFDLAFSILNAVNSGEPSGIQSQMETTLASYPALQFGTFLTNHDIDRVFSQFGNDTEKMKLAAAIYLTLPGIPFIYYGEEINMTGTGAHENIRKPMQWSSETYAGFSGVSPWNSVSGNYIDANVKTMDSDPSSILNHYKKLIRIRNEQPALRRGNFLQIESGSPEVLSFARMYENEAV